eukprot:jgi/Astpho2/8646/Aster-x0817
MQVGKTLPKAQNETNTTIKSRSINLPGQSVGQDKAGAAVTQRNLSQQDVLGRDLLGQVGHYSERVRRDALKGLQDLLTHNPRELRKQTGTLLERLAERMHDPEVDVRAALKDLLQKAVLPPLRGPALVPFLPLLMAHLSNSLTALAEPIRSDSSDLNSSFRPAEWAIRADALDFLEMVTAAAPQLIVTGLERFLRLVDPSASRGQVPTAVACRDDSDGDGSEGPPFQQRCAWPRQSQSEELGSLEGLLQAAFRGQRGTESGGAPARSAQQELVAHLLDCWTECSPAQLGVAPELPAVQCMAAILACLDLLLEHTGMPAPAQQRQLLGQVTPHLPAPAPVAEPGPQLQAALTRLNLAWAKLLASFLPAACEGIPEAEHPRWIGRLLSFYQTILEDGGPLPGRGGREAGMRAQEVHPAVLRSLQQVLPHLPPVRAARLLQGVHQLFKRTRTGGASQAACLRLWLHLLQQAPGTLPEEAASLLPKDLPMALWRQDLESPFPALVLKVVHTLLSQAHSLCLTTEESHWGRTSHDLSKQIAALFCGVHVEKRACPGASAFVPGGLEHTSPECQALAVDIIYLCPTLPSSVLQVAAQVCITKLYPVPLALRLMEVIAERSKICQPKGMAAFLLTLLAGRARQVPLRWCGNWRRQEAVACGAAWLLLQQGPLAGPLLDALAEPLLGMANGDAPEAQDRNLSDAEDRSKLQLRACLGVVALSTAVLKAKRLRHTSTANGRQEPAGSNHQQIAVAEASDARSYVQLPASLQSALPDIAARLCLAVAVVEEPWPDDGSETAVAEEHPGQADGYPSQECQEAAMKEGSLNTPVRIRGCSVA